VAVSGGVDSAVAAWILREQGWQVMGATLRVFPPGDPALLREGFSDPETTIQRAEGVCRLLDIPHRVMEVTAVFRRRVLSPFFRYYETGLTPNPCVWCNPGVKWNALLRTAREMGCAHVATGHYARTEVLQGRVRLLRGRDPAKDQSYALYRLGQEALQRTVFPLGGLHKQEVRRIAQEQGIPGWDLPESQDLCFLASGGLGACLSRNISTAPGPVVDRDGVLLGTHKGLVFFTVGQRKGLGIPRGRPIYVIRKEPWANRLVVGPREALQRRFFSVRDVCWVSEAPPPFGTRITAEVELRFRSRPIPGVIHPARDRNADLALAAHDQPVAPGQSAVWYRGDVLLGGGIICPDPPPAGTPQSSTP